VGREPEVGPSPTLLDSTMPDYDVREVHEIAVDAPPDVVWSALHEVSLREVPVFRGLMTLRELPGLLLGRRWLTGDVDRPLLEQVAASAFVPLAERPISETVLGLLTRPWRGQVRGAEDAASFLAFDEAGWVKAVLGFRLEPQTPGTRLVTETRVFATDASARRRFGAYWLAVGWASGLTRRAWLQAVRRAAECAPRDSNPEPAD
jgi:hypothetical protein